MFTLKKHKPPPMTGYSKTPLANKLGLKPGMRAVALNAPADYHDLLGQFAKETVWQDDLTASPHFIHVFADSRSYLEDMLPTALKAMDRNGMLWVSWPKKASKVPTDVVEDTIRALCLPLGLVDVKVCAVDEIWSGLKLVIRKELR